MKTSIFLLIVLLLLMSPRDSNSQETYTGMNKKEPSSKLRSLTSKLNNAQMSGDKDKMQEIQTKIDSETGSVTKTAENYNASFIYVNQPVDYDNINVVELSQLNGIRALATVTEQRGVNVGRIWVIAAISNSTERDTILYFSSDDGGTSWVIYGFVYLGNSDEVSYDQMDVELIEDNLGEKYIWTVYGLKALNGKKFIGANVLKTPTPQLGAFALAWQGENFSNTNFGRFRPRITSDNARYSNASTVYISASLDTFASNYGGRFNFAKCVNPYTTSPSVTYIPTSNGLILGSSTPTDLHNDIAYCGNDAILFVGSHYYSISSTLNVSVLSTNFDIINTATLPNLLNYDKEYSRIACSGGINQLTAMVVYRENYQNSGDWDFKGYKTINGGNNWTEVNIDTRRDNVIIPFPADINAVRNRNGRFNIAYTIAGPSNYDTVKYIFTDAVQPGFFFRTVNHLSGFERPKPGFRLVNNDSCFVVWSQKGGGSGNNIWAAGGCSGQITIGIENLGSEMPSSYKLEQNYPNPFNPVTNIKFSIPKSGYVRLVVYDLLGIEAETLVNENLGAGTYKTDFDASRLASGVYFYKLITADFSEIKKMVLVK